MKPSAAEFLEIETPEPERGCVGVRDQSRSGEGRGEVVGI